MTKRPCIDCGVPADDTRCPTCSAKRDAQVDARRGTAAERGYDARWRRLSERARRAQPFCSTCHRTDDLTADHLRWPARTLADVEVLCRPCNSKKGPAR